MIKCVVNGYVMDLSDGDDFAVTYEAANDFKFHSNNSVEISFPKTANNLLAIENNHVIVNSSTLPYNFIPSSIEVDGIDMKMDYAILRGVSDVIKMKFYGGNITVFADVKEKSIQDLDLSEYDHTRNWAFIDTHRNTTSGILYPVIDYGNLTTLNKDIEAADMYPAIFVHTLISKIASEIGYTLSGSVLTDADYLKLIIPFCNKTSYVDPDVVTSYLFKATLNDVQALIVPDGLLAVENIVFLNEITDVANRFDGTYYTVPITGTYTFHIKHRVQVPTDGTQIGVAVHLLAVGGETAVIQTFSFDYYSNVYGIVYEMDLDVTAVNLKLGDRIYVDVAADYTFYSLTETTFSLVSITNTAVGYDEFWAAAPNLPNIKQGELIKYVLKIMGAIVQCDDATKTIILTKLSTIVDNCYTSNFDDWSDLLDRSIPDDITFTQDIAQTNHIIYLDEENVVKPVGTDYDLIVSNKSLIPEKDLYTAPFGASEVTQVFTPAQNIWRVDIQGASSIQPRILVSNYTTLGVAINFNVDGATHDSTANANVPYFISDKSFNLGFGNNLRDGKMKTSIDLLISPRQLRVPIRLSPIHINQLDFSKPVWIDYHKCWFYKSKISQFKYNKNESTFCELIKIL